MVMYHHTPDYRSLPLRLPLRPSHSLGVAQQIVLLCSRLIGRDGDLDQSDGYKVGDAALAAGLAGSFDLTPPPPRRLESLVFIYIIYSGICDVKCRKMSSAL